MPRDASGNYTLPAGNPVVTGTVITSTWANPTMSDIANEITNSLSRNGQGGMLAPLFFADGTINDPSIAFTLENGLGMYRPAAGVLGIAGQGGNIALFDGSTLNVAVGGVAPIAVNDLTRKDYVDALGVSSFDDKLAGYLDTGLHENYTGDLDDIAVNSAYLIDSTIVTNGPSDWTAGVGVIVTSVADSGAIIQVLYCTADGDISIPAQYQRTFAGTWQAWVRVVDGGAFTQRLAGFKDNGTHQIYTGDLNNIITNSWWMVQATGITNGPTDFVSDYGILSTMVFEDFPNPLTQILYGLNTANLYKVWMRHIDGQGTPLAWKLVVDGAGLYFDASNNGLFPVGAFTESAQSAAANAYTRKDYVDDAIAASLFPAGTSLVFRQSAAPTGWTKSASHNNKALRIVSGNIVDGGTVPFTTAFSSQNVGATTLTWQQSGLPAHQHNITTHNAAGGSLWVGVSSGISSTVGATDLNSPPAQNASESHTHALNIAVEYVDLILATKD